VEGDISYRLALAVDIPPTFPPPLLLSLSPILQPDGSFTGDEWGEVDTRFSYCGLSTLALLGRLSMAGEGGRKGGKEEG